jgi:outer membrane protein
MASHLSQDPPSSFTFGYSMVLKSAVVACALLSASTVWAEKDALVNQAAAMVQAQNFKGAYDLLEPQEVARAGDPDFDLAFGVAANGIAQHTRAVFALERVLTVQPNNALARAELGRALFALNDTAASKKAFEEAKQAGVPESAQRAVNDYLQAIERSDDEGRTSFRANIETSAGRDSNINSATGTRDVAVPAFGGLVLTLNPAGVKIKSSYLTLGGGGTLRMPLANPRLAVVGNLNAVARHNFGNRNFDTAQLDGQLGMNYRLNRNEFTAAVQGLVGEWSHRLDGYRQFSLYGQAGRLKYPGASVRDANRYVLGGTYAHGFRNNVVLIGGAYAGTERVRASGVDHLGHRLVGLRTAIQAPLAEKLLAFASLNFERRVYGGTDPLFLVSRRDRQTTFTAGLAWVPAKDWRVTPQIQLVRNNSNTAVTDYDRNVVSVTVRKDF